jgi:hypothetical protein
MTCKKEEPAPRLPLHRLPSGTWITLSEVTRIQVFTDPRNTGCGIGVTVFCGEAVASAIPFDTETHAQNYADELATLANRAP